MAMIWVRPVVLYSEPGLLFLPPEVADRDDFRQRTLRDRHGVPLWPSTSRQLLDLRLRLLQPVRHIHPAVRRRRVREGFAGRPVFAGAPVKLAEAEVAVGDEGPHAAGLGQRQRLPIVGLAVLGIEPIGMGRDLDRFDAENGEA